MLYASQRHNSQPNWGLDDAIHIIPVGAVERKEARPEGEGGTNTGRVSFLFVKNDVDKA